MEERPNSFGDRQEPQGRKSLERRYSTRQRLGVLLLDLPRYARVFGVRWLGQRGTPWVYLCNRMERLQRTDGGPGVRCSWRWTSELHAPKVFPSLGRVLLRHALEDFPVRLREPDRGPPTTDAPDVTFVIGHRGTARLPHLLLTLRSIAAQVGAGIECIVVEQDDDPSARGCLPSWVRYVHTPLPYGGMPYSRAWAFNVGARQARGRLLVLHDGDLLVPSNYAAALIERSHHGYEVVNLKRFIFYLSERHTRRLLAGTGSLFEEAPHSVLQNAEGGGSIGIDREVYESLGGFDEEFVGWGGEDNEFWDRALTRRVYPFGYLPFIHLWHWPQPGRRLVEGRDTARVAARRDAIPPEARIRELRARDFGNPHVTSVPCRQFQGVTRTEQLPQ